MEDDLEEPVTQRNSLKDFTEVVDVDVADDVEVAGDEGLERLVGRLRRLGRQAARALRADVLGGCGEAAGGPACATA